MKKYTIIFALILFAPLLSMDRQTSKNDFFLNDIEKKFGYRQKKKDTSSPNTKNQNNTKKKDIPFSDIIAGYFPQAPNLSKL